MTNYESILEKLKNSIIEIQNLTKFENLSMANAKKSRELGKKSDKYIKQLIANDDGIIKCKSWFYSSDCRLKWNAAMYLYPMYPKESIVILNECIKIWDNDLDKSAMSGLFHAYNSFDEDNIFIKRLKKIYNTDDLLSLNKE